MQQVNICLLAKSLQSTHGGGIYAYFGANPDMYNVVIENNIADDIGGGVYTDECVNFSINNTVVFQIHSVLSEY